MADETRRAGPKPSRYVADLKPYDAVSSLEKIAALGSWSPLKLDWNESTVPPPPAVQEAVIAFLSNSHPLNWYPDLTASALRKALSAYTGLPEHNILVTNGSDGALELICRTYLEPGNEVAVVWPTYGHFLLFAKSCGAIMREVEAETPFSVPTQALLAQVPSHTKIIYVASPNNPTGVVVPPEDVSRICEAFPSTLVIVDEAYYEFCGETSAPLVPKHDNLVVTRTFSKCFSIAAVRIGYLLAGSLIMSEVCKLHNPKSVNALGQVAATAALAARDFRESLVKEVTLSRDMLAAALRDRGAEVRTTKANFILVRVANPEALVQALESVGVFVRDRSKIRRFEGYVRITVGTRQQTEDLLRRIDLLLTSNPRLLEPPT